MATNSHGLLGTREGREGIIGSFPEGERGEPFFTKLTSWLKILSRLRKPGIATQKYKKMKSASLNFHDSATALIDDYHKTLLGIQTEIGVNQSINHFI